MISINTLNLREIRKKTGYTQKEMASFFGINLRIFRRLSQKKNSRRYYNLGLSEFLPICIGRYIKCEFTTPQTYDLLS